MENTTYTRPAQLEHTHTIIFLHGRDSTAAEFAEELFESQASDDRTLPEIFPTIKWVFPASKMRNSARFNSDMSQWFDMWSIEEPSEKEEIQLEGIKESVAEILSIIRSEAELASPERIILAGISQGCATAIHALLYGGVRLGGFIGISSWLPLKDKVAAPAANSLMNDRLAQFRTLYDVDVDTYRVTDLPDISNIEGESALDTPIFLCHSQDDEVVPIKNGMELYSTLQDLGMKATWRSYEDGGHCKSC